MYPVEHVFYFSTILIHLIVIRLYHTTARFLCTLRSAGCPYTTQHSVPAGGQPFSGRGSHPLGYSTRFQIMSFRLHHHSPPPGFVWRKLRGGGSCADLPVESVKRLTCDGSLVTMVDGDNGQPLNAGRKQRTVPTALKRTL